VSNDKTPPKTGDTFEPGEAADTVVSLSQILLAPLDALFKAQVHAGRSFLNFLLQLSYEHKKPPEDSQPLEQNPPTAPDRIFSIDFVQEVAGPGGTDPANRLLQKVSVPALALVPLRPLAIQEAEVDLAMEVTYVGKHRQLRKTPKDPTGMPPAGGTAAAAQAESDRTPWYLVHEPISLRGYVGNAQQPADTGQGSDKRMIQIKVKVGAVAMPSGLDKLLTTLTQSALVENLPPKPNQ